MEMKLLQNMDRVFCRAIIKPCRISLIAEPLLWVVRPGNVRNVAKLTIAIIPVETDIAQSAKMIAPINGLPGNIGFYCRPNISWPRLQSRVSFMVCSNGIREDSIRYCFNRFSRPHDPGKRT
jgi:hypothetical protein